MLDWLSLDVDVESLASMFTGVKPPRVVCWTGCWTYC